jgi:hypothetical protein
MERVQGGVMFKVEKDWISEAGLRCVAIRGGAMNHRCGYVGIGRDHPLYEVGYMDESDALKRRAEEALEGPIGKRGVIPAFCTNGKPTPDFVFDVHGSITYSGGNDGYPVKDPDIWWFGFDCNHYGDDEPGGRSLEYVVGECESLAAQLMEVKEA